MHHGKCVKLISCSNDSLRVEVRGKILRITREQMSLCGRHEATFAQSVPQPQFSIRSSSQTAVAAHVSVSWKQRKTLVEVLKEIFSNRFGERRFLSRDCLVFISGA